MIKQMEFRPFQAIEHENQVIAYLTKDQCLLLNIFLQNVIPKG